MLAAYQRLDPLQALQWPSAATTPTGGGARAGAFGPAVRKALLVQGGYCLSPRLQDLLCGTPRSVLDAGVCEEEDVVLNILPAAGVLEALQVRGLGCRAVSPAAPLPRRSGAAAEQLLQRLCRTETHTCASCCAPCHAQEQGPNSSSVPQLTTTAPSNVKAPRLPAGGPQLCHPLGRRACGGSRIGACPSVIQASTLGRQTLVPSTAWDMMTLAMFHADTPGMHDQKLASVTRMSGYHNIHAPALHFRNSQVASSGGPQPFRDNAMPAPGWGARYGPCPSPASRGRSSRYASRLVPAHPFLAILPAAWPWPASPS